MRYTNPRLLYFTLLYFTDTDLCPCGETQTMSHIVESCPLTKLNGGLSRLHSADEDAVLWLSNYGKWHAYEKKKKCIESTDHAYYGVSTKITKPTVFSIAKRHQITAKCSDFWRCDLRNNCKSGYDYVFHLTCVMPIPGKNVSDKLRFGNKQTSQMVKKTQMQEFTQH